MATAWMDKNCDGSLGCGCKGPDKRGKHPNSVANLLRHGSRAKYQKGCRCTPCTRANTKYSKDLRERKVNGAA